MSIVFMMLFTACKDNSGMGKAKITITKDYGNSIVKSKKISVLKDYSVMDAMKDNFKVQTAYNGSFVNSIEGLKSTFAAGQKGAKDWFYFVNGKLANSGAKDYKLNDEDSIIWDYHKWDNDINIKYCIGSYPQPFISNSSSNTILYSNSAMNEAEYLAKKLKATRIKKLHITKYSQKVLKKYKKIFIMVGLTKELQSMSFIREYEKNYVKTGMPIRILNNKIEYRDNKNNWKRTGKYAGFIVPVGDDTGRIVWLIGATNKSQLKYVINLFDNGGNKLKNRFAICINKKSIINIP